jgi:hypothetical protein
MLFQNISPQILYLFLHANSERIFEKHKKLVWTEILFVHFSIYTIGI